MNTKGTKKNKESTINRKGTKRHSQQARSSVSASPRWPVCSVSPRAGTTRGVDVHPQLVRGADAELTARVQEIHAGSRGTYGAPRIHAELAEAGVAVGRKRVARVMRAAGIAGVSRRRGPRTTRREVQDRPAPDRVERRFEADAPNRLWVADITYIPTLAGFLYLAIVLDVFSRRVVGPSSYCPQTYEECLNSVA